MRLKHGTEEGEEMKFTKRGWNHFMAPLFLGLAGGVIAYPHGRIDAVCVALLVIGGVMFLIDAIDQMIHEE